MTTDTKVLEDKYLEAIMQLKPTGPDGFEGFVRDLLQENLGTRFRLMKSGHQGGVDMANEPYGNTLSIGVEGKRYGSTKISLDALKYKIHEASQHPSGVDLWVLATTREVSATDALALRQEGEVHGIFVAFLDTLHHSDGMSPLALLGACAPDVVTRHLGNSEHVAACLQHVCEHPQYTVLRSRLLEQFRSSQIGYESARQAAAAWLKSAFTSAEAAKAKLHCFADIEGPEVRCVRRDSIYSRLGDWWDGGAATPLVLLGSEGMGKTWSVLAWWEERHNASPEGLPLTLVVPAEAIQQHDPIDLLAKLLEQRAGYHSEGAFWQRRLVLWQKDLGSHPKIILVIDGLNQRPLYREWDKLLQPLFAEDWQGQVAIIMTCRTQYWGQELRQLANLLPRSQEITVSPFSQQEVDELLGQYGLNRNDFSADLQQLLCIPRFCQLAIVRHHELESSSDITPERLVYEDWKHRIDARGSDLAVSDHEFHELIARIGQRLRAALSEKKDEPVISRGDLLDDLARHSGKTNQELAHTLGELIDGRWFQTIDNKPNRFRLNGELAPFALGLALLDSLLQVSEVDVDERLAQFLDPLRGMDYGTDILRAASTAAILDPDCSDTLRRSLMMRWVSAQNIKLYDFEALWRLMGETPELFLDVVEEIWLWPERGVFNDEVFIGSLTNASRWDSFEDALRRRLVNWFGLYTLDPVRGQVLGYQHDDPKVRERQANTRQRRQQWDRIATELGSELSVPLTEVEVDDAGQGANPSWLSHRAAGVLSFLPRATFVQAILAWAVSRGVMGSARHFEEIAWALRLNPVDAAEANQQIMALADQLIAHGHEISGDAGRYLLDALATPEAARRAASLRDPRAPTPFFPGTVHYDYDTHIVTWSYQEALDWPRSQECPLDAALGLKTVAVRPEAMLDEDSIQILRGLSASVDASGFWRLPRQHSRIDSNLETTQEALARWAPDVLCDLLRGIYDSITDRNEETGWGVAIKLPEHLLLLRAEQLDRVSGFAEQAFLNVGDEKNDHFPWLYLQLARIIGKSAAEQIALLGSDPDGPMLYLKHWCVLATPVESDFNHIARFLNPDASHDQLRAWLTYLSLVSLEALPEDYEPFTRLISHDDSGIRAIVLKQIVRSDKPHLLKAFVESDWHWVPGTDSTEGAYGSLALCRARKYMEVHNLLVRIEPRAFGELFTLYPDDDAVLEHFLTVVRDEFRLQVVRKHWPATPGSWTGLDRALEILAVTHSDELIRLLDAHITNNTVPLNLFSFDLFPVVSTLRALIKVQPEEGVRLWLHLWKNYYGGSWLIDAFENLPFCSTEHTSVLPLREMVLNAANTDADLQKYAIWAEQKGHDTWLIAYIHKCLGSIPAGEIARGMSLAGYLDHSDEADTLWSVLVDTPLYGGWLEGVRAWSYENYIRNIAARHWLNAFIAEDNPDRAFGDYLLFTECADARALEWGPSLVSSVYDKLPRLWQCHWSLNYERLSKKVEKRTKNDEKYLFGTKIFKDTHSPWLRILRYAQ